MSIKVGVRYSDANELSASRGDKLVAQVRGYLSRPVILTRENNRRKGVHALSSVWREKKGRVSREPTAAVEISTVVLFLPHGCFSARATVRVACREISPMKSLRRDLRSPVSIADKPLYSLLRLSLRFLV